MGIAESNFVPTLSQVIVLLNTVGLTPEVQARFLQLLTTTYNVSSEKSVLIFERLERSWYSSTRMLMLELSPMVEATPKQQHAEWVEAKQELVNRDFGDEAWWALPLIEATDQAMHDHWNRARRVVGVAIEDVPVWSDPNSIVEVDPEESATGS